jgi:hypothetical protein
MTEPTTDSLSAASARFGRRLSSIAVVVGVFVQVIVPLIQLRQPRPARFGWQMYAGIREPFALTGVAADGSTRPIEIDNYLAFHRGDIAISRILPPVVCDREQELVAIRFQVPPEDTYRVYQCVR